MKTARFLHLVGGFSVAFLFVMMAFAAFPFVPRTIKTNAAPAHVASTTTLTMTTPTVSLLLNLGNADKTFATSDPATFSVITDNYSGYTLSISAKLDDANSTKLVNGNHVLNSISVASVDDSGFDAGEWGYRPSKINSLDNTSFLPAPTYTGSVLDTTNTANSTANTYSIAVAAKVDYSLKTGTYSNTFVLNAAGNPTGYIINYSGNSDDSTIAGIPATQSGDTVGDYVVLSSASPTRAHYTFNGWCEGTVSSNNGVDSCTGAVYQPGDSYYLDFTGLNSTTLKALWSINTHTVQLVSTNGTGATTKTVNYGSTASFTNVGPNPGYQYSSLSCTNGQTATISGTTVATGAITNDTVCTATFTLVTYSISYNLNNGWALGSSCAVENTACSFSGTRNICYGANSTYICKEATNEISCSNGVFTDPLSGIAKQCYLSNFTKYNVTSASNTLINPVRDYYTFAGWSGTGISGTSTSVTIPTGSTGNRTYTASWTPITYTITYTMNGGAALGAECAAENATCNFSGTRLICYGASGKYICKEATNTISCSNSVFTDPISGTVKKCYLSNITRYNAQSAAYTLITPTRAGYTFTGWTGSNGTTAQTTVTIPTGSGGNKSYTANWRAN